MLLFSYLFTVDKINSEILNDSVLSVKIDFENCKYSFNIFSISSTSTDSLLEISISLINASWSFILVRGVLKSWLIPDSISDLWFKCLRILLLILSNSYPAFLISKAPDGRYSSTFSPRPNFSETSANLIRGLVWFFKKIIAIAINNIVGKVIHKINNLIEEACILSLGKKICRTPFLNFILKSTTSLYDAVLNQYWLNLSFNSLLKVLSIGLNHLSTFISGSFWFSKNLTEKLKFLLYKSVTIFLL